MNILPPFKFFALQNFPFIEMDFDALTEVQLIYKIAEYLKKVANRTNENTKDIQKLIEWIQTLDLTDEVNQKLNEMAEDGTLAELINHEIFDELNSIVQQNNLLLNDECKIYFPYRGQNAGDCSIIQNAGKTILIDIGVNANALIQWLIAKNITKIDYIIISHYHYDHVGQDNAEGFVQLLNSDSIDTSECLFYLPHKGIDWTQVTSDDKQSTMANESAIKNAIVSKGLTYVEPDNLQLLVLSPICYLKFMNIGSTYYNNYYGLSNNQYNNFSMVVELKHNNRYSLFTGDITTPAENNIAGTINQPVVLKAPHHDLEPDSSANFLRKMTSKVMMVFEWNVTQYDGIYTELAQTIKNNQGNIYDTNNSQDVLIILKNDSLIENSTNGVSNLNNISILNANGIHLNEGTDLNEIKTAGTYYTNSYLESNTLINSPTKVWDDLTHTYTLGRCKLIVIALNSNPNILIQYFITGNDTYYRILDSANWKEWTLISNDNPLGLTDKKITTGSDLNDIIKVGKYAIENGDVYTSLDNTPSGEGNQGGSMLFVLQLRTINDVRTQLLLTASGNMYVRHGNMNEYSTEVTSWSNWKKFDTTEIIPE